MLVGLVTTAHFENLIAYDWRMNALIAQRIEHRPSKPRVPGSNPGGRAIYVGDTGQRRCLRAVTWLRKRGRSTDLTGCVWMRKLGASSLSLGR
jgi:hypothetical protein